MNTIAQMDAPRSDAAGDPAETVYTIQPALWPEPGISTEELSYLHIFGAAGLSLSEGGVVFAGGGRILSDTYYNLFNLGKWRDLCGDVPVDLRLTGKGEFQVAVFAAAEDTSWERVFGEAITLDGTLRLPLRLEHIDSPRVVLFFEIIALSRGRIDGFAWVTTQAPRQKPQLALSVTTFRREAAVESTAARFADFHASSDLRDFIRMIVIDNGQSLLEIQASGVTVIPNANLGGAGGFSRGLIEARATGASHCLFMDDDASVHMGAITRTWWLLAYATDPRTAVAGAMINAGHRWQIWENGAVFERGCHPQFFGLDTRDTLQVLEMEFKTTYPAKPGFYAGWWFFAFPVDWVTHMPFPFFVRGDDVSFSLANDLRIVTLPGVASVQESFSDKASPLTWYLDMRSHLAHHLSLPDKARSWVSLQRMLLSFYLRTVLRFHYDSLSAVNLAIEDVLQGPDFFARNADMAQRRQDLKALTTTETWQPNNGAPTIRHGKLSRMMRAILLATFNGHLLPFANTLGSTLTIEAAYRDNFREIYGARQITYVNALKTATYTVQRDRSRFWKESWRLLRNTLRLRVRQATLQDSYQSAYALMTSEAFWQEKLELKKD